MLHNEKNEIKKLKNFQKLKMFLIMFRNVNLFGMIFLLTLMNLPKSSDVLSRYNALHLE